MINKNLRTAIKDSLYGFSQEYETFKQCPVEPSNDEVDTMLEKYKNLYNNILLKHHDMLPNKLVEDIRNLIYSITKVLKSIRSIETILLNLVNACVDEALEIYNNFDNYFTESL